MLEDLTSYHKFQVSENREYEVVSSLFNQNIAQNIVALNTYLQVVAVKVTAPKPITL